MQKTIAIEIGKPYKWRLLKCDRKCITSEPFAMRPVQFSWPRRVAENWLTKPGFGEHFVSFPRRNSRTQSSLIFFQSGPRKFTKSDFSGLAPIQRVLITAQTPAIEKFWSRDLLRSEKCDRITLISPAIEQGLLGLFFRYEKGTQTQTFWSGYFPVGWGSSTWRGGGQKVRCAPQNQGNQTFLAGYPGILLGYIPAVPEKFEKKKFVFNFRPLFLLTVRFFFLRLSF